MTAVLDADVAAIVAESRRILRESTKLVRAPTRGGGNDAALAIGVLADGAPICADCIARKAGIPRAEISTVIERVRKRFRVETPYVSCHLCRSTWRVYQLHEPGPSDLRLVMVALWNKRLCITCLVTQTGVPTARVDELLTTLSRVLTVGRSVTPCDACSAIVEVATLV